MHFNLEDIGTCSNIFTSVFYLTIERDHFFIVTYTIWETKLPASTLKKVGSELGYLDPRLCQNL